MCNMLNTVSPPSFVFLMDPLQLGIGSNWYRSGVAGYSGGTCKLPLPVLYLLFCALTSCRLNRFVRVLSGEYSGAHANAQYQAISGCPAGTSVPLENDGRAGTRCYHWDEVCMGHEIMTGVLTAGNVQPLSAITIGSLEDLRYTVDYSEAEPITLHPSCDCHRRLRGDKQPRALEEEKKRKLSVSPSVRAEGLAYGKALLEEGKKNKPAEIPEGMEYLGDQFVTVLLMEMVGDELVVDGIDVTADD